MSDRKTILVVDDVPANIDLIKGILGGRYKIKAATSGERGLRIAAKCPAPDLILLDVMMPEMDGFEVCERLKGVPATAAIPVLFITAHADDGQRRRARQVGALELVSKPVNPVALQTLVDSLLDGAGEG